MALLDRLFGGLRSGSVAVRTGTDGRDFLDNTPDGWERDTPWYYFSGPAGSDGTGGPWGNPPAQATAGWPAFMGGGLPAVTYCTSLIADGLAGLPWHVFRDRERQATPAWIEDPQALRWDDRISGPRSAAVPDWRLSVMEFRSQMIVSLLWYGNAFIYTPVRGADGQPIPPVWLLHPDDVHARGGSWFVGRDENDAERLDADEIIAIRGEMRVGKIRGVGVLQANMPDLKLAEQIRAYASGMLNRGIPAGYLKVTAPDLTEDEANLLKARWEAAHGGTRRRIAVLGATTDFHALSLDSKALELIEMRRYSLLDIALMFRVPPYKLGVDDGSSNTYSNVESRGIEFVQDTLMPWSRRIEAVFDANLPRGTNMKINLDGLRRADTITRYRAHQIGLQAGFLTVDEVRDMEDLQPRPETLVESATESVSAIGDDVDLDIDAAGLNGSAVEDAARRLLASNVPVGGDR